MGMGERIGNPRMEVRGVRIDRGRRWPAEVEATVFIDEDGMSVDRHPVSVVSAQRMRGAMGRPGVWMGCAVVSTRSLPEVGGLPDLPGEFGGDEGIESRCDRVASRTGLIHLHHPLRPAVFPPGSGSGVRALPTRRVWCTG